MVLHELPGWLEVSLHYAVCARGKQLDESPRRVQGQKAASVSRSRNQRDREATANHVATGRKDLLLVLITR